MSRANRSRLERIEERTGHKARGLVVIEAEDGEEGEKAAIAAAKASGLAQEGDGFIIARRFGGNAPSFTPYRIGDVPAMLRRIAEEGRKIFPGPNCQPK